MKNSKLILLALVVVLAAAATGIQAQPGLFYSDISYGPHARNKLDLWTIRSAHPVPVVLYLHGGGFTVGDKADISRTNLTDELPKRGIAVASANYRLLNDSTFYPIPEQDAVRVVQFLRYNAAGYNLDPQRIGISGSSAGANMALWIALHDDMADPLSTDPLRRVSTQVQCVMVFQAPTSNDPNWIFSQIANSQAVYELASGFFGIPVPGLKNPGIELQKIFDEASPIFHVSSGDPPVFLLYDQIMTNVPLPPGTPQEAFVHHPMFGLFLKSFLDFYAIENELYWASGGTINNPMPPLANIDFIDKVLNSPTTGIERGDAAAPSFELQQNYPNPFNSETIIRYTLAEAGYTRLVVYDVLGKIVANLVENAQPRGIYAQKWNGRDTRGKDVPSGIYFYELKTQNFRFVRKLSLIR